MLESTNGEHQKTTASASFTNAGTITLTKSETNNNNARLAITSGNTLTNSGTITSEAAEGTGHRFLEGSITNTGTLNIDSDTEYNTSKAAADQRRRDQPRDRRAADRLQRRLGHERHGRQNRRYGHRQRAHGTGDVVHARAPAPRAAPSP